MDLSDVAIHGFLKNNLTLDLKVRDMGQAVPSQKITLTLRLKDPVGEVVRDISRIEFEVKGR